MHFTLPNDIVSPPPPSIWPLAPGFWLLIGLVVIFFVFFTLRWRSHRTRRAARQRLVDILADFQESRDSQAYYQQVNILLKRLALASYETKTVASLFGMAWLSFLDEKGKTDFSGRLPNFANAPYDVKVSIAPNDLYKEALKWINHYAPAKKKRSVYEKIFVRNRFEVGLS